MPFTLDPNARNEPKADPKPEAKAPESFTRNTDGSQSKAEGDPNEGNSVAQANAAATAAERAGAKKAAFDETGLSPAQIEAKRADNAKADNTADLAAANETIAANKKAADDKPAADKKAADDQAAADKKAADDAAKSTYTKVDSTKPV